MLLWIRTRFLSFFLFYNDLQLTVIDIYIIVTLLQSTKSDIYPLLSYRKFWYTYFLQYKEVTSLKNINNWSWGDASPTRYNYRFSWTIKVSYVLEEYCIIQKSLSTLNILCYCIRNSTSHPWSLTITTKCIYMQNHSFYKQKLGINF